MKKTIGIVLLLITIIILACSNNVEALNEKNTSIYMWEVKGIDYEIYDKMVDYLNINKIYAYIGTAKIEDKIDEDVKLLFEFAKRKNIDIYVVYDENYEDQTENANRIKEFINEIQEHNKVSVYKIKGVAIDSEFHSLDIYHSLSKEEKIQLFREYVSAMKTSYECAKQSDLDYVVCIPVWLNKLDEGLLEELIKNGCSYVQLMNYSKTNMIENISEEVAFAKKYNKKIENIAEFQIPGPHEVTDNDTFYNDGLEAGISKFKEIDDNYNYDLLSFSFHYYKPVLELYQKLNIDNNNNNSNNNNSSSNNEQVSENKTNQEVNQITNQVIEKNENINEMKTNTTNKTNTINNMKNENSIIDNTKATGTIPKTGEESIVFVMFALIVSIVISSIKLLRIKMEK